MVEGSIEENHRTEIVWLPTQKAIALCVLVDEKVEKWVSDDLIQSEFCQGILYLNQPVELTLMLHHNLGRFLFKK